MAKWEWWAQCSYSSIKLFKNGKALYSQIQYNKKKKNSNAFLFDISYLKEAKLNLNLGKEQVTKWSIKITSCMEWWRKFSRLHFHWVSPV